jgi:hypothetical protein
MSYKKFSSKDLIYNTIVANPKCTFTIHKSKTYYQSDIPPRGDFDNNIKHISEGDISIHELNINRPSGSLIYPYLQRDGSRQILRAASTQNIDEFFEYGDFMTGSYPMSASASRIYISSPASQTSNKKYYNALKNPISSECGPNYAHLSSSDLNLINIPGIFYGSKMTPGTIELSCYITGTLAAKAEDPFGDGRLFQTYCSGSETMEQVGVALYNQGIMILTSSNVFDHSNLEKYEATDSNTTPTWKNFATGLQQTGSSLVSHGECPNTSYEIKFKGYNKIPTLTMFAYSQMGDNNYSHNPTFIKKSRKETFVFNSSSFQQKEVGIKKVNKSFYSDHEEPFENNTYISKIGIYDKYKNLIAIVSLATPIKKTEKRDYMFKIGIDF